LLLTGFSNDSTKTIKTIGGSGVPKLLSNAFSDNVGLSSLGSFVSSSESLKFSFVLVAGCIFRSEFSSLGLIIFESTELGLLKLTGVLTDESFSGSLGLSCSIGDSFSFSFSFYSHESFSLSLSLGIRLVNGSLL
jgi:hypothetical protein